MSAAFGQRVVSATGGGGALTHLHTRDTGDSHLVGGDIQQGNIIANVRQAINDGDPRCFQWILLIVLIIIRPPPPPPPHPPL